MDKFVQERAYIYDYNQDHKFIKDEFKVSKEKQKKDDSSDERGVIIIDILGD